ncbi:hypothetical protein GY45DRAFT_456579 [Cubamyces sp. BRFM 1775]|nr:hypothetical protein GY45DRAFT_456579 [Cubamyces sp. BRFM 1775]
MPWVHAENADGASFDVSGCPITALTLEPLRPYTDQLRHLTATSLSTKEYGAVQALLKATMPRLEQLRVSVDTAAEDGQTSMPHNVPEPVDLPPTRFPALRTLMLEGVRASLGPLVASRLWHLEITNKSSKSQGLALLQFINCIGSFKCLEKLYLSNCFSLATVDGCRPREPFSATRLMFVFIKDHPPIISRILSALIIPARARVELVGNMRGAPPHLCFAAFSAMLPDDKRCLPVLQNLWSLDVYHAPEACYFTGTTASEEVLDLSVVTDALHNPELRPSRGELFDRMIHGVRGIFPGSPIERLVFVGDIDFVAAEAWVSCLARFPLLRELEVDDVDLRSSPNKVIAALMQPSGMHPEALPVCPQLESLALYGDISSLSLLDDLRKCLSWRQERLGGRRKTRLRELHAGLYCNHDMSGPLLEKHKVALARFAVKTDIEVIEAHGHRQR